MKVKTHKALWFGLALIIFFVDQYSKQWINHHLNIGDVKPIITGMNFIYAQNTGAAFSFLAQFGGWQVILLALIAGGCSLVLGLWLWRLPVDAYGLAFAGSVCLGGALGNLLDRIRFGYVIDFIDLYWKNWHWYTFNIADVGISLGVFILLIHFTFEPKATSSSA